MDAKASNIIHINKADFPRLYSDLLWGNVLGIAILSLQFYS